MTKAGLTSEDTRSHADRVAVYYDENTQPFYLDRWHPEDIHFGLFPEGSDSCGHYIAVKQMTARIIAPATITSSDFVLDAGCGVGGASIDIAQATGARVFGLTVSPYQVRAASLRADLAVLAGRVRFARADCATELPCDDASVDVVVTIEAACHFADKPRFLRECRRVLKAGGRLVGSDWMAADGTTAIDDAEYLRPVCETWRLAGMETPSAWRAMLLDAGFRVREEEDFGEAVLANARILARARLDLMLEVANGCHPAGTANLWEQQYDALVRAWTRRHFTIGRFFAVAP